MYCWVPVRQEEVAVGGFGPVDRVPDLGLRLVGELCQGRVVEDSPEVLLDLLDLVLLEVEVEAIVDEDAQVLVFGDHRDAHVLF